MIYIMSEYIDPEVLESFLPAKLQLSQKQTVPGFVSRSAGGFISCPPYVIASVAARRVAPEAQLDLPEGYDQSVLEHIQDTTGFVDVDVAVSSRQAEELSQLGAQILALNQRGEIQPPLSYFEEQSVRHLVNIVGQTAIS